MIHAAIFATTDPAERSTLIVTGGRDQVALNTPDVGCWRAVPATCTSAADLPALGALPADQAPADKRTP